MKFNWKLHSAASGRSIQIINLSKRTNTAVKSPEMWNGKVKYKYITTVLNYNTTVKVTFHHCWNVVFCHLYTDIMNMISPSVMKVWVQSWR